MPEKTKTYKQVIFTPEVIKQAEKFLVSTLPKKAHKQTGQGLAIRISPEEEWEHDNEEEFFAAYIKGFERATYTKYYNWGVGSIRFNVSNGETDVSITMPSRSDLERVFNVVESFVEKCRLPKKPKKVTKAETDWVNETTENIYNYCPTAGSKVKSALIKLELEDKEEWQSACMLVRDAWIELSNRLCKINKVNTSDIDKDAVVDKLKAIGLQRIDERLFNLARGSFNLAFKHHDRGISHFDAIACVVSSIVSMKTVIEETLNARSEG